MDHSYIQIILFGSVQQNSPERKDNMTRQKKTEDTDGFTQAAIRVKNIKKPMIKHILITLAVVAATIFSSAFIRSRGHIPK